MNPFVILLWVIVFVVYLIQLIGIFCAWQEGKSYGSEWTKKRVLIMMIPFGWLIFMYKWFRGLQ